MIPCLDRAVLNLGKDQERMTDQDAVRQHATVDRMLTAFFGPQDQRREIQLLADEVGLGKTFVALATAFTVLAVLRHRKTDELLPDLQRCFRAVLVVTPAGNHALAEKWGREVEALRTRCSLAPNETNWFRSKICDTPDELVESLVRASDLRRDPEKSPCVLICEANIFTRRLRDAGGKLRFLAASLFRWWGNKLSREERYHIVRRAGEVTGYGDWAECARRVGKGEYEVDLWNFRDHEIYLSPSERKKWDWGSFWERRYAQIPFTYEEVERALNQFAKTDGGYEFLYDDRETDRGGNPEPSGLLPYCKWVADRKGYPEWYFDGFKNRLLALYKELTYFLMRNMRRYLPLVIADEAHHWRHSSRQDCRAFREYIAPFARRLLLLTATPFQLHRDEIQEVLATSDSMEAAIGADRVAALQDTRGALGNRMLRSEETGRSFSAEWGKLADQLGRMDVGYSEVIGRLPAEEDPRTKEIENQWCRLRSLAGAELKEKLQEVPGAVRPFFARALELRDANRALQQVMGQLIIRHRRQTEHRRYWIGREYPPPESGSPYRPDRSQLHLSPGRVMPPGAELAQYLLMRVVAEITRGKHRTTLGMDLTGCYTTLWKSKQSAKAIDKAAEAGNEGLVRLLKNITGAEKKPRDAEHPKVETVAKEVMRLWEEGEKTLIFCFRVPTAETLHGLLTDEVDKRLKKARKALLEARGTAGDVDQDKAMQSFRRSLTAREGSGVPLFLDRLLLGWLADADVLDPKLTEADYTALARLCGRARRNGRPLFPDFERPDRVFLHRAVEHVLARRLREEKDMLTRLPPEQASVLQERMADEDWIRFRYGERQLGVRKQEDEGATEPAEQLAHSSLGVTYDLAEEAETGVVTKLADALQRRAGGTRPSILDTLLTGPNLLLPLGDARKELDEHAQRRVRQMRDLLLHVTRPESEWLWAERAAVLDAVVRAFLREDILLRLPRDIFRGEDETWSESLFRGFHQRPKGGHQREPLAERIKEFLDDLKNMGTDEREAHLSYATKPNARSVEVVTGSSGRDRDSIFNGFNTPLLPDILICTQVGQEGIDLHRHCRHVIHYDLGWNPASVEQRTGRADRIGSKAARERKIAQAGKGEERLSEDKLPGLDIALPYLAGTYDERMFNRLRTRAQVFDILTGGDPTADQDSETHWLNPDSEGEDEMGQFVPLPRLMLSDLRVNLAVIDGGNGQREGH